MIKIDHIGQYGVKEGRMPMIDAFHNLSKKKQDKVINAALLEFINNGYHNASTNNIVNNAGISKGMLFYYFESKKKLFEYLIMYCIKIVENDFLSKVNYQERDFIKRYRDASKRKLQIHKKNEHVLNFLGSLFLDGYATVPDGLSNKLIRMSESLVSNLHKNIDTSLFREDIDEEKIMKFIMWTFEGYQAELIEKLKRKKLSEVDYDPYWEEFDEYIEALRKLVYK